MSHRKLTAKQLQEILGTEHVSKSKGAFIIRKSYFYRMGYDSSKLAEYVKSKIPNAIIIDRGDHWAPFRGGDSVAKGSHFWVRFTVVETLEVPKNLELLSDFERRNMPSRERIGKLRFPLKKIWEI